MLEWLLVLRPRVFLRRNTTVARAGRTVWWASQCVRRASGLFALAAAAIALVGGGGRAELRVRDDARHAALWFRLYDDLPRVWKTRKPVLVREIAPRDMERLVARLNDEEADRNDDTIVDGCYQDGDEDEAAPIITLCDTLRGEHAGLVFTHEYGHFVWNQMLTEAQRARYTRIWKNQKRAHHLVTEYAQDSNEEGFAEAFAYFLRKPAQIQRADPNSTQFLRELQSSEKQISEKQINAKYIGIEKE